MAERVYRVRIEGRVVELRRGDLGAEQLLVDGRPVSRRLVNWGGRGHHVDVRTARGDRHLEVRLIDASKLGIGRYVAMVSVDGVLRARVEPVPRPHDPVRACLHCAYPLDGLEADREEIRCPECGRHTPEVRVGPPGSGIADEAAFAVPAFSTGSVDGEPQADPARSPAGVSDGASPPSPNASSSSSASDRT